MKLNTKKLTALAMLSAIAFVVMLLCRIPVVLFLKYEPKDVVITLGGYLFGPMAAILVSAIVSFVEMFTVSEDGLIGFIMNVVSTCAYACTAAFIFRKRRTPGGAIIGLTAGTLTLTAVMMLWNYFLTPIYLQMPQEAVAGLLIPAILPFNLLKGGLNSAILLLIYRPVLSALHQSGFMANEDEASGFRLNIPAAIASSMVIATAVMVILVLQ